MTEREALKFYDAKKERYYKVYGLCENCGKEMTFGQTQAGHLIRQSKANINKYGKKIIHSPENWKLVCSLKCNSAVDISFQPKEVENLINEIRKKQNDN